MTKERRERFALFHEQIALSLTKNEQIAQKTDEQIPNPALQGQRWWARFGADGADIIL